MSLQNGGRPGAALITAWTVVAAVLGSAGTSYGQAAGGTPFGGSPFLIPARSEAKLEAENFDRGPEGAAYHDNDAANAGKQYRAEEGVDIGLCNDAGGGYRVGWIAAGEWLKYRVRVSAAGKYNIVFRVSSRAAAGAVGGKMHLEDANGTNLSGDVSVPGTGDTWQDVRANNVPLAAGDQTLQLVFDGGGFNLNYMTFSPAPAAGAVPAEATAQAPVAQPLAEEEQVVVTEEPAELPVAMRLGAFTEENAIGDDAAKGQLKYAQSGVYTLRGGTRIGGTADAMYLVSSKALGDGQIIAKVESVEGTGTAGVMYRESTAPDSRFAAVLVTGGNGTAFQRRSDTGGSVLSATALGAKPPVWIRLVRSGTNFSAFYSANPEQPGANDWKPIGTTKPVAMPEAALVGLASAAGEGTAVVKSVAINGETAAAAVPAQETGAAPVQEAVAPSQTTAGASLSGSYADVLGKVVNLSAGATDWVHYGHNMQQENRKVGVPQRIGSLDAGGGKSSPFGDNRVKYTWSDGTPTRSVSESTYGTWSEKGVFKLTVRPGDTRPHTLIVYVGGFESSGQLTASLPGAPQYSDTPRKNTKGTHFAAAYTLNFRAASPNDVVSVQWKLVGTNGNIQFHGVQLR